MKITVAKASPHDLPVPDVEILIGPHEPPAVTDRNYEAVYRQCFQADATRLMDALTSLPGGTWDRLFALMVEKKASLLKVPLFSSSFVPSCDCPNCREAGTPPKQSVTMNHLFPLVLQTVLWAGENEHGINFNDGDTKALAAEIRKLLERP